MKLGAVKKLEQTNNELKAKIAIAGGPSEDELSK